jgi:GDP-4-dehydro-6-deoxy-D-mannose reductase
MKLLITGINGFVAGHFLEMLHQQDRRFNILGVGRNLDPNLSARFPGLNLSCKAMDLIDKDAVAQLIHEFRPDYLLHLASVSSVGHSWSQPHESFVNNTNIFLNLIEQIRIEKLPCRILSIGSSEEYGNVNASDLPIKENNVLKPISPYAVARVSQEMISEIYHKGYGLNIIMTRSFNHIGPGQKDLFVIASFARKLVEIKINKQQNPNMTTGNLSIIRDLLDVRDIVSAYYELLLRGTPGEVYNICSGIGTSLEEMLKKMCAMLEVKINIHQDPKLIRPMDNQVLIGDPTKIKSELGWNPKISLDDCLRDILEWWKKNLTNP